MRTFLLFCFVAAFVSSVAGQVTVTNADLEQYRQERLRAQADLRANYARMGFPSPEEIARRNDESQKELVELADKLRAARLESERMDIDRDRLAVERERIQADRESALIMAQIYADQEASSGYSDGGFSTGSYGSFGGGFWNQVYRGYRGFRGFGNRGQEGYYVGGQFWPTGPRTAPRPIIGRPHH